MRTFEYTITDEVGIHARPAGALVKLAKEFAADITLTAGEKQADLKKLMALMALGIRSGQTITVTAQGADEDLAEERIKSFLKENL